MGRDGGLRLELARIHRALVQRRRSPADSQFLKSYLGSPAPVLGLSAAELRTIARESAARWPISSAEPLHRMCRGLWKGRYFEQKALALLFLRRHARLLNDRTWRLVDPWVDQATGWALSDDLASGPISWLVAARPERFRALLRWTRSRNPWRRRASLYALNRWVRSGALDRPFRLLDHLLGDRDRWVQRAVGTWARECWKQDPSRTRSYLMARARRLSPTAITVATERAPRDFRVLLRGRARRLRTG